VDKGRRKKGGVGRAEWKKQFWNGGDGQIEEKSIQ
jgi:hypothetical protein